MPALPVTAASVTTVNLARAPPEGSTVVVAVVRGQLQPSAMEGRAMGPAEVAPDFSTQPTTPFTTVQEVFLELVLALGVVLLGQGLHTDRTCCFP
ncbi:hypothetical protein CBW56_11730 [Denitratisoma oestradiolicum]|nr:hypothetical protein CBW56_11730 [Denitratisoma oestradiolicum]